MWTHSPLGTQYPHRSGEGAAPCRFWSDGGGRAYKHKNQRQKSSHTHTPSPLGYSKHQCGCTNGNEAAPNSYCRCCRPSVLSESNTEQIIGALKTVLKKNYLPTTEIRDKKAFKVLGQRVGMQLSGKSLREALATHTKKQIKKKKHTGVRVISWVI